MTKLLATALLACTAYGQFLYTISNLTTTPMRRRQTLFEATLGAGPGYLDEEFGVFQEVSFIEDNLHVWNEGQNLLFQDEMAPVILINFDGHQVYAQQVLCDNNNPYSEFYFNSFNQTQFRLSYECTYLESPADPSQGPFSPPP